jgi:hypothetical protein
MWVKFTQTKNGLPAAFSRLMKSTARRRSRHQGLHALLGQRAGVHDGLLADLAEARIHRRVVRGRGLAVQHAARAEIGEEVREFRRLRVVRQFRFFGGVQMVERAVELIEPVDGGQEFIPVAQMVLAELAGGVALSALSNWAMVTSRAWRPCAAPGRPTLVLPVRKPIGR